MPIKDAIILAGGFGTRLRPLTARTPKPLLPLGNRPFVESLFARLAGAGVERVVLSVHHQAPAWRHALPKLRRFSLKVVLRRETRPLGTGGAIRFAWPDPDRSCLVLNGDALSDFDISRLQRDHSRGGNAATLWALAVDDTRAFGVLECGAGGHVTRFVEKPRPGQSRSHLINAGLYALEPNVLHFIPRGRAVSVEREVFPELLHAGLGIGVSRSPSATYWNDIGTPEAFLRANMDLLGGRLWGGRGEALRIWGRPNGRKNLVAVSARIAPGAKVSSSVLGSNCRIDAGAEVRGCVLLAGVRVEQGARLEGVLLSEGVHVGARCQLKPGLVLGSSSRLAADSRL
ncbi:MAG: sugar phosphate nucleotidyltransferase [bacterium]